MTRSNLGNISKLRKGLGMTQKQLADLSDVSQSLIAKIESGKIDPAYSKVSQIFSALESARKKEKKTAEQIGTERIISVLPTDRLDRAIRLMRSKGISQLPVLESGKCVGSLSEGMIVELLSGKGSLRSTLVGEVMSEGLPAVPAGSVVDVVVDLLRHYPAVLLERNGKLVGIVTKADLLKAI